MKLVENWKESWKFLSNISNLLGIVLLAVLADLPSHLAASWSILPDEFKTAIPQEFIVYVAIGWFIVNIISRLILQFPKKDKEE